MTSGGVAAYSNAYNILWTGLYTLYTR